jgi:LmbE family N-acetylglucosaminyl deacetylase
MDIYLQPHSDDICFSLGALAAMRKHGVLLTVCPIAGYVPVRPGEAPPPAELVTKMRMEEDRAFCAACGLEPRFLEIPCGSYLGYRPFGLERAEENVRRIGPPMLEALLPPAVDANHGARPWLFCPAGVGGHVDHVAIRMVIAERYDELAAKYRVAFYEDLHYASAPLARRRGVQHLLEARFGKRLRRRVIPLAGKTARKLSLIQLYRSQFLELPISLAEFVPATRISSPPHEAIWTQEAFEPFDPDATDSSPKAELSLSFANSVENILRGRP